jgi:hypothetical protein
MMMGASKEAYEMFVGVGDDEFCDCDTTELSEACSSGVVDSCGWLPDRWRQAGHQIIMPTQFRLPHLDRETYLAAFSNRMRQFTNRLRAYFVLRRAHSYIQNLTAMLHMAYLPHLVLCLP